MRKPLGLSRKRWPALVSSMFKAVSLPFGFPLRAARLCWWAVASLFGQGSHAAETRRTSGTYHLLCWCLLQQ